MRRLLPFIALLICMPPLSLLAQDRQDLIERARIAAENRDWQEASELYWQAIEADEEDGEAWYRLGYCLHMLGEYSEALVANLKATSHPSLGLYAHYNAATACAQLGEVDEAFAHLLAAIEGGYQRLSSILADRDLRPLHADPRWLEMQNLCKLKIESDADNVIQIGVLVYRNALIGDFANPLQTLLTAPNRKMRLEPYYIAQDLEPVQTQGVKLQPDYAFSNCPVPDVLIIPGGHARDRAVPNVELMAWVKKTAPQCELVIVTCNGTMIAGLAGLLDGERATTNMGMYENLREWAPGCEVVEGERFVRSGRLITAAEGTAGIDAGLCAIEILLGADAAQSTARRLLHPWAGLPGEAR